MKSARVPMLLVTAMLYLWAILGQKQILFGDFANKDLHSFG